MILLVGIPGSGKSTFAKMLTDRQPSKYVRINQDELGNRRECERLCRNALARGQVPIIDRCNFDLTQRRHFLSIASEARVPVDCVVFSYPADVCVARCQDRQGHETITRSNAAGVVRMMERQFSPPVLANRQHESYRSLRVVRSFQDVENAANAYCNGATR